MDATHSAAAPPRGAGSGPLSDRHSGAQSRDPSHVSPAPDPELRELRLADRDATLRRATGSDDARVHDWLVNDVAFALTSPPALGDAARQDRVCAALTALCDIAPRDAIEGMLAAQMVAVHSASLDCLRRAADPASGAQDGCRNTELFHAARLLSVFHRQARFRDDRRNPQLTRSLTGMHAPDAPGNRTAMHAAPEGENRRGLSTR